MPEFFETRRGAAFFDRDVPQIARALARIADALERLASTREPQPAEPDDPEPREDRA